MNREVNLNFIYILINNNNRTITFTKIEILTQLLDGKTFRFKSTLVIQEIYTILLQYK